MTMSVLADQELAKVRIAGYGGQGIVLAGMLLGKAASLYAGLEAVLTQSYGPAARGGASCADIVISRGGPVGYPLIHSPHVLAVLFQEAYDLYRPRLDPHGTLIIEESLVQPREDDDLAAAVPAIRLAEELGSKICSNVVTLGFLVGRTGVVNPESVHRAIMTTVKPKMVDLNIKAFNAGCDHARKEVSV